MVKVTILTLHVHDNEYNALENARTAFCEKQTEQMKMLIFTDSALATWQLMAQATLVKQKRLENRSCGHSEEALWIQVQVRHAGLTSNALTAFCDGSSLTPFQIC